jgi:hypothetical protein
MTNTILRNYSDKCFGLSIYTIFKALVRNSRLSSSRFGLIDGQRLIHKGNLQ